MSDESQPTDSLLPLSVQRLRERVRDARGGFAPDHVASALRYRYPRMIESDAAELATMLKGLIDNARERLLDAGIVPLHNERATPPKLSKRERDYVSNLATLMTFQCDALTHESAHDDAVVVGMEAVAWCRTAGDHHQQSIAWRVISSVYRASNRFDEQERAMRNAIDEARRSGVIDAIIATMNFLCAFLVIRGRVDEAEPINDEVLSLLESHPEAERHYAYALYDRGRIKIHRMNFVEGIRTFREALRRAEKSSDLRERGVILNALGSVYLRLGDYRQCIQYQHEVIRLAEKEGSDVLRGIGFHRLAEAHTALKEFDVAEEMLDKAEACRSAMAPVLMERIVAIRIEIYTKTDRLDEATALCMEILDDIDRCTVPVQIFINRSLGEIAMLKERYEEAEKHYRTALAIAEQKESPFTGGVRIQLAKLLHTLGRESEVLELLEAGMAFEGNSREEEIEALRLRATVVEAQGELASAIEYERKAFEIERVLLERRAEESLRNARIIAETDLLEREAEIERERRRRVEHELADAVVELGDRKRKSTTLEERLRTALQSAEGVDAGSATKVLEEALRELRTQTRGHESPLKYLSGVEDDFYRRLRERFPGLTSKQEQLCALLRAGLASKEIASLLGVEAEGLKTQRKRLRKRLGLGVDERLEVVLGEV